MLLFQTGMVVGVILLFNQNIYQLENVRDIASLCSQLSLKIMQYSPTLFSCKLFSRSFPKLPRVLVPAKYLTTNVCLCFQPSPKFFSHSNFHTLYHQKNIKIIIDAFQQKCRYNKKLQFTTLVTQVTVLGDE